jgi:hypothetical protein
MAVSYSVLPESSSIGTIYFDKYFDTSKDIVVSFDYACYGGSPTGDEGFCVSFVNAFANTVSGGGPGPALGYTSLSGISAYVEGSGYQSQFNGLYYGEIGVGFDLTGNYGSIGYGVSGYNTAIPNSITVRDSYRTNYTPLYNTGNLLNNATTPISLYQQVTSTNDVVYNRARIRLTDFGSRLVVDLKRPQDLNFTNYININNQNIWPGSVRGCMSFATGQTQTILKIKNFCINGFYTTPDVNDIDVQNFINSQTATVPQSAINTLNSMVSNLKGSGLWGQYSMSLTDTDASSFISTANITDVVGKAELGLFTTGIKGLGIWNTAVYWPLRSNQNTAGLSALSIGGLISTPGQFDAIIKNNGSYTLSGVALTGISINGGKIVTGNVINLNYTNIMAYAVGQAALGPQYLMASSDAGGGSRNIWLLPNSGYGSAEYQYRDSTATSAINTSITFNSYASIGTLLSPTKAYKNGILVSTSNKAAVSAYDGSSKICFGTYNDAAAGAYPGIVSFGLVYASNSNTPTDSVITNINNIYKNTLGYGLALP